MWIKFSEAKPENGQHVYYYFDVFKEVYEGYYEEYWSEDTQGYEEIFYGKHGFLGGGEVTHWMPYIEYYLPDPPKEEYA